MNKIEAEKILKNEKLKYYNIQHEHEKRPNEVIIYEDDCSNWVVCAADERASIVETSYKYFDDESEAFEYFIKLVRLEKILLK